MGLGVGAAMAGMRPVVELMYLDFLGVCFDQLLNQAAKLPFMTGGAAEMALTVRTQFGAGRSSGSQHSQSLEALLAHIPGLTVVMPSTPADTYGLLRAAIQDPNPVVFIENRLLYGMKGPQPPADYVLPIGKSAVVRPGTDVTVVSVSRMVHEAVAAAERVARGGHLRRGDRPADGGAPRHGADPRLGAQDEPAPHRPRGGRPLRHRRRDRGHRGPGGVLGPRCAHRADRGRRHAAALRARPRDRPGSPTATTSPTPSAAWLAVVGSAAQGAGDDQVLDLVGALADLEHLGVAVEAGHRRLEHVAEAAVDLDRLRRRPGRHPAGLQLGHGRLLQERLARCRAGRRRGR